jgi:hypothetical protein
MIEFTLQDNFVVTNHSIIAVFSLEPIDVILLPESEQQAFEADIHRTLNNLGNEEIQLIMRTRNAEPKDMDRHFRDIANQDTKYLSKAMQNKAIELRVSYVSEIKNLLVNNMIPIREYYIIFKELVDTKNNQRLVEAVKKLDRKVERVTGNFLRAGIKTSQVTNYDTVSADESTKTIQHRSLEKLFRSFIRL